MAVFTSHGIELVILNILNPICVRRKLIVTSLANLVKLPFKPIHQFLFFFCPIANKLGDLRGKRALRVREANIGHVWQSEKKV